MFFLAFSVFFTGISCIFTENAFSFFPSQDQVLMPQSERISPQNKAQATPIPATAVFLGESTTTHWRTRGGIPNQMIWANESGTMRLDSTLLSRRIVDPETQTELSLSDALLKYRPSHILLSFGLNGILNFANNRENYIGNYKKLIHRIQQLSPETEILVQTVYPVARAEHQSQWNFSVSPAEINEKILILNSWLCELCQELESVKLVDTAAVLRDLDGFLPLAYTTDGIHLTEKAYAVLRKRLEAHFAAAE